MGFFSNIGALPGESLHLYKKGACNRVARMSGWVFHISELNKAFFIERVDDIQEAEKPVYTEYGWCSNKCVSCFFNTRIGYKNGYCSCPIYCNSDITVKEL